MIGLGARVLSAAVGARPASRPLDYGVGLLLVVFAWAARELLGPDEWGVPFLTFLPAVMLTAALAGLGPAIVATAASAALAAAQYFPPFSGFESLRQTRTVLAVGIFVAEGVVIAFAVAALQRTAGQLRLASRILEQASEGVIVTDAAGRIVAVNRAFSSITGYELAEIRGRTPALLKSNRHDGAFYAELWRTLSATGSWRGEIWNRRKSGEIYLEWLSIDSLRNADGSVANYVGMFSDITPMHQSQQRAQFLASHDPLTELPNRALFDDHLRRGLARAQRSDAPLALLFVDLDDFKMVNDSLGHEVGDEMLVQVARRLADCVRTEDTVARLGGDEFVVLLESAERAVAAATAQRVLDLLARPFTLRGETCLISGSVGISMSPDDGVDASALMRRADTAMYCAKERGKGSFVFYGAEMGEVGRRRWAHTGSPGAQRAATALTPDRSA